MKLSIISFLIFITSASVFGQKLIDRADGYLLKIELDKSNPVYHVNEVIHGKVTLTKDSVPVKKETVIWIKSKDNYAPSSESKKLTIKDGQAEFTASLNEPGFVLCRFNCKTPAGTMLLQLIGIAVDPQDIKPSLETSADFVSYWKNEKKKQEQQPLNARYTQITVKEPGIEVFDVQANSLGGNFSAYMARPLNAKSGSLPAMICFQGAGVASSRMAEVIRWAKEGVCVIDFNVHGLPNGQPQSFYKELYEGPLKQYFLKGVESRDSLFFHSMVFRVLRAIEIITAEAGWDGKNLIAFGRSQGGGQAIIAAGIDPRVNLLCAEIPALCDHTGNVVNRVNGWPKLMGNSASYDKKALQVVPYFDAVNFASRTKAKSFVTVGFIDLSCPPTSVYAMYNQLGGKKSILDIYDKGHVVSPEFWKFVCDGVINFLDSIKKDGKGKIDLIEESQTGSSPLFFKVEKSVFPETGSIVLSYPSELIVRNGLPNFFDKIKKGKDVSIGYIGGSITRSNNQYRMQSLQHIQNMFPNVKVTGMNAGISGTGSDLGACRLNDQLLQHNPDLIFIEFAVNRAFAEGVEGIIRQIWKRNPKIDICLIHTISSGQAQIYEEGKVPENIARLERVAEHYEIPSIHMGLQVAYLEKEGTVIWKADPKSEKDKIVFTIDGIHPTEEGGNLYAGSIERAMRAMLGKTDFSKRSISDQLLSDNWEDAKMLDPLSVAKFEGSWEKIETSNDKNLKSYADWFPYVMKSENPGSYFSFEFEGNMFGIFDVGGPEVGQLEIEMDGYPLGLKQIDMENFIQTSDDLSIGSVNRFNRYCNNRYRGQCAFFKVAQGKHQVKIRISEQTQNKSEILGKSQLADITAHPDKYAQSVLFLGKILIRGEILPIKK